MRKKTELPKPLHIVTEKLRELATEQLKHVAGGTPSATKTQGP